MTTLIRLLQLPYLASEHVLNLMDISDKYKVSTISERAWRLVRFSSEKRFYHLNLTLTNNVFGEVIDRRLKPSYFEISSVDGSGRGPIDVVERKVIKLAETFYSSEVSFYLKRGFSHELFAKCITSIEKMNIKLNTVYYRSLRRNDNLLKSVLEQAKNAEEIHLLVNPNSNIEVSLLQSLKATRIWFRESSWLTEDHLLNSLMNRIDVEVKKDFETSVFNAFIKRWIEGSSIISFHCVRSQDFELASCFTDIEGSQVTKIKLKAFTNYLDAHIIEQVGGQKAAVYRQITENYGYEFALTTSYEIPAAREGNLPNANVADLEVEDISDEDDFGLTDEDYLALQEEGIFDEEVSNSDEEDLLDLDEEGISDEEVSNSDEEDAVDPVDDDISDEDEEDDNNDDDDSDSSGISDEYIKHAQKMII